MKKKIKELKNLGTLDDFELNNVITYLQGKLNKRKAERELKEPKLIEYIRVDDGCEGTYIKCDEWDDVDPIDLKNYMTSVLQNYDDAEVTFSRFNTFEDELEDNLDIKEYDWFTFNDKIDISKYKHENNAKVRAYDPTGIVYKEVEFNLPIVGELNDPESMRQFRFTVEVGGKRYILRATNNKLESI